MIFVKQSATCAVDGTHLTTTPVVKCSLINLACNKVRDSWHAGGAARLIKSNKLLQSVATIEFCFPTSCSFRRFHLEVDWDLRVLAHL